MLCPSEYLNTPFSFSSLQDDDHFSPEADAAMSEMTGNTALLAQVCGWGRRLAGQPGAQWGLLPSAAMCPGFLRSDI